MEAVTDPKMQNLGEHLRQLAESARPAMEKAGREMAGAVASVERASVNLPVPRELLLEAGMVEPTVEEKATMDRDAAESERRAAERETKLTAARAQLAAITEQPARTILDLHQENTYDECMGDDFDGWEAESPPWPCTTVVTIAKHYGIDITEGT